MNRSDPAFSIYDTILLAALEPSQSVRDRYLCAAQRQLDAFARACPTDMNMASRLRMRIERVAQQAQAN